MHHNLHSKASIASYAKTAASPPTQQPQHHLISNHNSITSFATTAASPHTQQQQYHLLRNNSSITSYAITAASHPAQQQMHYLLRYATTTASPRITKNRIKHCHRNITGCAKDNSNVVNTDPGLCLHLLGFGTFLRFLI